MPRRPAASVTTLLTPALLVLLLVSLSVTLFNADFVLPRQSARIQAALLIQNGDALGGQPQHRLDGSESEMGESPMRRPSPELIAETLRSPVAGASRLRMEMEETDKPASSPPTETPSPTTAPVTTEVGRQFVPEPTTKPAPTPVSTTPTPSTVAPTTEVPYLEPSEDVSVENTTVHVPTPPPTPAPTIDPMFPPVEHFPADAQIHSSDFVSRSPAFDSTVSRDKGVVLCLHDKAVALGLSLIKELRCLGNQELIQVYYCGATDLSDKNRKLIMNQDDRVEIIDVCGDLIAAGVFTNVNAKQFKSWWIKPLAVHHSNLKELILLDADDILLQNPASLRASDGYRQNGTLFFYDRVIDQPWFFRKKLWKQGSVQMLRYMVNNIDYAAFNLPGPRPSQHLLSSFAYQDKTCHEMDSSMVLIDKTRAGKAMDMLWWLTTKLRLTVEFSWGDKEAFWLAFELAQQPYAFTPWGVSVVSSSTNKDMETHPDTLCGSIAQYVPSNASTPAEVLYINGRALLDPLTQGTKAKDAAPNILYNTNASHVVPRMERTPRRYMSESSKRAASTFASECLVGLGSTPLPPRFHDLLFRRRLHFLAVSSGVLEPLKLCSFRWQDTSR